MFSPEFDFHGNRLQDLLKLTFSKKRADVVAVSLLATENGGIAFFSWQGRSKYSHKFIQSLNSLPNDELVHALIRLVFVHFENFFISPDWWEGLPDDIRKKCMSLYNIGINEAINKSALKDDGVRYLTWRVVSRETNIAL